VSVFSGQYHTTGAAGANVTVYKPDGSQFASGLASGQGNLDMSALPVAGDYRIRITPNSNGTGTYTTTLSAAVTDTVTINGASVSKSITRAGQDIQLTFTGVQSTILNLAINSTGSANGMAYLSKPDGSQWTTVSVNGLSNLDLSPLPADGVYTLRLNPNSNGTGTYTVTLSTPVTGTLAVNGATLTQTITRPGQDVRLTFSGDQGQVLNLAVNSTGATNANVTVYKPDGAQFDSGSATGQGNLDMVALPVAGSYTIVINPVSSGLGTYTFTLSTPLTGSIAVDGANATQTVTRAGQDIHLTFTGNQSQVLNLAVNSTGAANANFTVYKPDGAQFGNGSATGPDNLDMAALPTTGVYTVVVNPVNNGTGTYTLTLSTPVTGILFVDGPAVSISITRPGQDARLDFSGTAGLPLSLTVNTPSSKAGIAYIYKPDTALLTSGSVNGTSLLHLGTLPSTGSYTVRVNPNNNYTGTYTLTLSIPMTDSTNLARAGTAYRWSGMTTGTANGTRTTATGLNDGLAGIDVDLNTSDESANRFEGAGVTWTTSQTIGTVKFIGGSWDGNGAFAGSLVLQTSNDGSTWVTSTWTVSPTYSYTNTTAGVTYSFTGAPVLVRGVRVVGQLNITGNTTKRARVREVMAHAAQNASLLREEWMAQGSSKVLAKPAQQGGGTSWQQLIAQLKSNGAPQANRLEVTKYYMFGGGRVGMRQANNEVFYTFGDHLGSSSLVVDWQGRKLSEMRYTPWGETRWGWELDGEGYSNRLYTSQLAQDRNYVGQLYDYGARFLNVKTGRFVSPDPLIDGETSSKGYNRYLYAHGNPIRYNDRSGNLATLAAGAFGALIGTVGGGLLSYASQVAETMQSGDKSLFEALKVTKPNWEKIGKSALAGGVAGGLIGLTGGAALIGGGLNTAGYVGATALTGGTANVEDGLVAFAAGSIGGALSSVTKGAATMLVGAQRATSFLNNVVAPLSGAIANMSQYAGTQAMHDSKVNAGDLAFSGVVGGIAGKIAGPYSLFSPSGIAKSVGTPTGYIRDIAQGAMSGQKLMWGAATFGRAGLSSLLTNYTPSSLWKKASNWFDSQFKTSK
jgi:RHS repeat-associated protein